MKCKCKGSKLLQGIPEESKLLPHLQINGAMWNYSRQSLNIMGFVPFHKYSPVSLNREIRASDWKVPGNDSLIEVY